MTREEKMLKEWSECGKAFSKINENDNDFFAAVDYNRINIRSSNGNDIIYYDNRRFDVNLKPIVFFDSFLAKDILAFPQRIQAIKESSNNPLGDWLISVSDENGLIDEYYYYTEESMEKDYGLLEMVFGDIDCIEQDNLEEE